MQDDKQPLGPEGEYAFFYYYCYSYFLTNYFHRIVLPPPVDADRYTFTAYAEEYLQNKQTEFTKVCQRNEKGGANKWIIIRNQ